MRKYPSHVQCVGFDAGSRPVLRAELSDCGDASLAVHEVWRRICATLGRVARRMADDVDDQEDLLQEALVRLWEVDPTRLDLRHDQQYRYLRRLLVNRMWDVARANWEGQRRFQMAKSRRELKRRAAISRTRRSRVTSLPAEAR